MTVAKDAGDVAIEQSATLPLFNSSHFNAGAETAIERAISEYAISLRQLASDIAKESSDDVQARHVDQAKIELVATPFDFAADFITLFFLPAGFMLVGLFIPEFYESFSTNLTVSTGAVIFGIVGLSMVLICIGFNMAKAPLRRRRSKAHLKK